MDLGQFGMPRDLDVVVRPGALRERGRFGQAHRRPVTAERFDDAGDVQKGTDAPAVEQLCLGEVAARPVGRGIQALLHLGDRQQHVEQQIQIDHAQPPCAACAQQRRERADLLIAEEIDLQPAGFVQQGHAALTAACIHVQFQFAPGKLQGRSDEFAAAFRKISGNESVQPLRRPVNPGDIS